MKKIFVLFAAAMMAVTVSAQHEIGGIVGGLNGVSYKYWFSNSLAIQADLAVGLTEAASGSNIEGHYYSSHYGVWDFTINPNVLYHWQLPANFKIYCGGGINFGMMNNLPFRYSDYGYPYYAPQYNIDDILADYDYGYASTPAVQEPDKDCRATARAEQAAEREPAAPDSR